MGEFCFGCFAELEKKCVCPYCGYDESADKGKYPSALPLGSILKERYIVGRVLGQGGFGITYAALDFGTKKLMAIKEYLPEMLASRDATGTVTSFAGQRTVDFNQGKEGFLEEANTLVDFKENPYIVNIHDFFEENGTAYFVMEFIQGMSLKNYVKSMGGKLGEEEANRILLPIMEALQDVHGKGIIHRDIAPDNIIVTAKGSAKLIDFGAARYSTGEKSQSLDVILKHGYAPKEQYTRRGKQGAFTDVYAMAATYYFAVTGRVPPDAIDRTEEEGLIVPHSLGIELKRSTEDALLKGLEVQHADRYQTMAEFMQALKGQAKAPEAEEKKPEKPAVQEKVKEPAGKKPPAIKFSAKKLPKIDAFVSENQQKLTNIAAAAAVLLFLLSISLDVEVVKLIFGPLKWRHSAGFYLSVILCSLLYPLLAFGFKRKDRRFMLAPVLLILVNAFFYGLHLNQGYFPDNLTPKVAFIVAIVYAFFVLLALRAKKPMPMCAAAIFAQLFYLCFMLTRIRGYDYAQFMMAIHAGFPPTIIWAYGAFGQFWAFLLERLSFILVAVGICALPKTAGTGKKPKISLPKTPIAKKAAPGGKPGKAETLIQKHSGLIRKISAVAALVLFVISNGGILFAFEAASWAAGRDNLSVPFYIFTALAWIGYLLIGAGLWLGRRALIIPTAMLLALSALFSFTFGSLYFVILCKLCSLVYAVFLLLTLRAERPLLPAAAAVLSQIAHVIVIGSWRGEYSWIYTFSGNAPTMKAIKSYVYSSNDVMWRFILIRLFLCIIALAICALPPVTEGARSFYLKPLWQKIKKLKK